MLRTVPRVGFVAGILATIALVGLLYLASALFRLSFIPYDLADIIIRLTPSQIATQGIEALGAVAKMTVKLVAVAMFVLFGGVFGALEAWIIARRGDATPQPVRNAVALGFFLAILGIALLNHQPSRPSPLLPIPLVVLAVLTLVWNAALEYLRRGLTHSMTPTVNTKSDLDKFMERRTFLVKSGTAVIAVAFGSVGLAELLSREPNAGRSNAEMRAALPTPTSAKREAPLDLGGFVAPDGVRDRITPQSKLYYVSSRIRDPVVDVKSYMLRIDGNVERSLELNWDQLLQLPRVDQTSTLQCVSNEVGGNLIGNCRWNGTRLADLLTQAGPLPGSQRVVLHGADGYVDSIELADALDPTTLVVYGVDGEPLTVPHGYPVRLIVPKIYGMKNVKWLQRIEVVDYNFVGFWQERGWSQTAVIKTTSVTDTTGTLSLEDGIVPLGGIAFAGNRGIQQLEVRIDDGPWNLAELEPAENNLQWRRWRWDWPATPGRHSVTVRAVDGTGELQTDKVAPPHPDGASGYHGIHVYVRG
jgi:DMSO/TMAO reductase YedYZ molybdopterin-dependent catalytic subunit